MINLKRITINWTLIVLLLLLLTTVQSQSNDVNSIIKETIQVSEDVKESLLHIQSLFPGDLKKSDERYILNEELKKDAQSIEDKKADMDRFNTMNDTGQINEASSEIKRLAYKIYAYNCMFSLSATIEATNIMLTNYKVRDLDFELQKVMFLLNKKEKFIDEGYRIKLSTDDFKSYEEYKNECESVYLPLTDEYQILRMNYKPFRLGGLGFTLLSVTTVILGWMCSLILFNKKIVYWTKEKIELLMKIALSILGLFWGLFFVQDESLFWRFSLGALLGFFSFFIIKVVLISFKKHIIKIPSSGTPIDRLNIDQDYIRILKKEGIKNIEDLLNEDIKELAENTRLQVETIIGLRKRGQEIINNPVTSDHQ